MSFLTPSVLAFWMPMTTNWNYCSKILDLRFIFNLCALFWIILLPTYIHFPYTIVSHPPSRTYVNRPMSVGGLFAHPTNHFIFVFCGVCLCYLLFTPIHKAAPFLSIIIPWSAHTKSTPCRDLILGFRAWFVQLFHLLTDWLDHVARWTLWAATSLPTAWSICFRNSVKNNEFIW